MINTAPFLSLFFAFQKKNTEPPVGTLSPPETWNELSPALHPDRISSAGSIVAREFRRKRGCWNKTLGQKRKLSSQRDYRLPTVFFLFSSVEKKALGVLRNKSLGNALEQEA
jgi:hypothetical protein